jgi:uncharacterized protein (TIGR00661 family)
MKCLFIIQGEGRGHMTQALALENMLRQKGHRVTAALVGRSRRRTLPDFFVRKIGAPVRQFDSPNFVTDAGDRSIRMLPTLTYAARHVMRYRESLRTIDRHVSCERPDLIVNFFEPLAGIYNEIYRPDAPIVCVGHQYLVHHPAFPFPEDQLIDRWALKRFTEVSALRAVRLLALSFRPLPDVVQHRITVMPPLLRSEVFELHPAECEYYLVYLLNRGYANELIEWHRRHPSVELHCFWDNTSAPRTLRQHRNLTFHQLDDSAFLSRMARCRALATTAGFESVCEAMYLGKPVMMVPVHGHFEQRCNALDALAAGAGVAADRFDLDVLNRHLGGTAHSRVSFRVWVESARERFPLALEEVVTTRSARSHALQPRPELRTIRRSV